VSFALAMSAHAADKEKVKEQKEGIRKIVQDNLHRPYKADPKAKAAVAGAAAYPVFQQYGREHSHRRF
jgi:hypothetical protein